MEQPARGTGVDALLRPRSIAMIGASAQWGSIGERPMRYLQKHGYDGQLFPVNPKHQELAGLPCYPSLLAVPGAVDLVLVAVSAERVFKALEDCAQKRVKSAAVFASGFAEVGGEGIERQAQLKAFAQRTGIRICGPNCQGLLNVRDGVAATFSNVADRDRFLPGKVGIVAQSGGLAGCIFDRAQSKGLGISYMVSTGNEADLETADYIDFMLTDAATSVVMAFVEGFKDGRKFAAVADKALELGKPLVILKGGYSKVGKRAACFHTGSQTGSDEVCDALFRQKGVARARDLDELVDVAAMFAYSPVPQGNRIGIFTPSGGAGVIMADACEEEGLQLADLSSDTQAALSKLLPAFGAIANPLDPTAQGAPENTMACLDIIVKDDNFDVVVSQYPHITGGLGAKLIGRMARAKDLTDRAYAVLSTSGATSEPAHQVLRDSGVPYFTNVRNCFRAIGAAVDYGRRLREYRSAPSGVPCPAGGLHRAPAWLSQKGAALAEHEAKELLSSYGIPVAKEDSVRAGTEVLIRMLRDDQFGPTIIFGLGGVFGDVCKDVALRVVPLTGIDAREMVQEIRGAAVLEGLRGRPAADVDAIVDVLLRLSCLARELQEEVSQVEINPLVVCEIGQGAEAVHAVIEAG